MNDDFETRVRERLRERARPSEVDLASLTSYIVGLPTRRAPRLVLASRSRATASVAAVVVIGLALVALFFTRTPNVGPAATAQPSSPAVAPSVGASWTEVPLGSSTGGATLAGVAPFGDGFLAIGRTPLLGGSVEAFRSTDGQAWTKAGVIAGPPSQASAVATSVDGRTVVAVGVLGQEATAWSSGDGITWTPSVLGSPIVGRAVIPQAVVTGASGFLVLSHYSNGGRSLPGGVDGQTPVLWFSPDGRFWTNVSFPLDDQVGAIAAYPSGFIAAGAQRIGGVRVPAIWTSSDGFAWSNSIGLPDPQTAVANEYLSVYALAVGPERILAVSGRLGHETTGRIWSSIDGTTWQAVANLGPGDPRISVLGWTPIGFVAGGLVGEDPAVQTLVLSSSTDGTTWKQLLAVPEPLGDNPTAIATDGTDVVVVGNTRAVLVGSIGR